MKNVLIPYPIDETCTLIEALYWVAFKAYPVTINISDDHPMFKPIAYKNFGNPQSIIPSEYYPKKMLIESPFEIPEPAYWDLTDMRYALIEYAPMGESKKAELIKERDAKQAEIDKQNAKRKEALERYLDLAKIKLFQMLKEGKIKAHGFVEGRIDDGQDKNQWEKNHVWIEGCSGPDVEMSKDCWRWEGINWEKCEARSPEGFYIWIYMYFDDLLKLFPESEVRKITLECRGDTIFIDDEYNELNTSRNLRGRPSYDWDSFALEMAFRVKDGSIPDKQESLVCDMQAWCKKHWGIEVGRSTLVQKISPYYDKFKKSENS